MVTHPLVLHIRSTTCNMGPSKGSETESWGNMTRERSDELQGKDNSAPRSVRASTSNSSYWDIVLTRSSSPGYDCLTTFGSHNSYWDVVLERSTSSVCDSLARPGSSISVPGVMRIYDHRSATVHDHSGLETTPGSVYPSASDSATIREFLTSQDSKLSPGSSHTGRHFSGRDNFSAGHQGLTLPVAATLHPKRGPGRLIYTCDRNSPLCLGEDNMPAREIVEEVCRSSHSPLM